MAAIATTSKALNRTIWKSTNSTTALAESGEPLRCDCGKLIAYRRGGRIYVMCKHCKKQVDVLSLD